MNAIFCGATSFNQPLSNWNMSTVKYIDSMFAGASVFNQPLNDWNLMKCGSMYGMFVGAKKFEKSVHYDKFKKRWPKLTAKPKK